MLAHDMAFCADEAQPVFQISAGAYVGAFHGSCISV
jgi:hypothetical protein